MALSGSYSKSQSGFITLRTDWTAAQNISGNYSTVTCNHYLVLTGSLSIGSRSNSCNVGGDNKSFTSSSINKSSGTTLLGTTTHTINHNADGTKSINLSTVFNIKATLGGNYVASITASGTATLDTIPRASSVTCNSFFIGDSTTININRASSSFTHTITYNYGTLNGTIATKTSSTNVGWTAPTTFYNQIPNGRIGYGSVTCQTYNGNTLIGTTTANFNAYAKESDCVPTVSGEIVDTNASAITLTGDSSKIIKYISKPRVTLTATARNYAIISSRAITNGDGQTSSLSDYTFNNGVSNYNFSVSATDSRAYKTTVNYNLSTLNKWVEYVKLAFTGVSITRPESTENNLDLSISGKYFNGSFGASSNTLTLKYRYKETGGTYGNYVTITPTITNNTFSYTGVIASMDYQKQFEFEVVAEDSLMVVSSGTIIVEKGEGVFRIGDGYIQSNGIIYDKYDTQLNNGVSIYKPGGVEVDPNSTIEELVLTETNTPEGGFWYVRTMFYGSKTATTNRTQIAYPYAYNATIKTSTYMRTYVSGIGWSAWKTGDIKEMSVADGSGYVWFSNGYLVQWGRATITPTAANTVTSATITFPKSYTYVPEVEATPNIQYPNIVTSSVGGGTTSTAAKQSMVIYMTRTNTVATTFQWSVKGVKEA